MLYLLDVAAGNLVKIAMCLIHIQCYLSLASVEVNGVPGHQPSVPRNSFVAPTHNMGCGSGTIICHA